MFSYPAANPNVTTEVVREIIRDPGGYNHPIVLQNGMPNLIAAMAEKIRELGGTIRCRQKCHEISELVNGKYLVKIDECSYEVDHVISSVRGWDQYPKSAVPGIPLTSIFCRMKDSFNYPSHIHTIAFAPPDINKWAARLAGNSGAVGNYDDLGFHCFRNNIPGQSALTVFIPSSPEMGILSEIEKARIKGSVLDRMAKRLPQFVENIDEMHLLDAKEMYQKFGISMRLPRIIAQDGFRPVGGKQHNGIYCIGEAVSPVPNIFGILLHTNRIISAIIDDICVKQEMPHI